MQFHSYLLAGAAPAPAAHRPRRPGRRRHHPGDNAATRFRPPRPRRRPQRYPGIDSLLRP